MLIFLVLLFPTNDKVMKQYADYMLLLSPNDRVKALVKEHKLHAATVIGQYESMHSIAHISINKMPRQKAFITEPALLALGKALRTLPPITLTIDGFDYFNHGTDYKTIYAKLRSNHQTTQWFKTLKKHLGLKEFMVPHITIARNIPVWAFEQLWPHFKAINWVEDITINELTILQRETFATFKTWEPFITLPFEARHLVEPAPPKSAPLKPLSRNIHSGQMSLF